MSNISIVEPSWGRPPRPAAALSLMDTPALLLPGPRTHPRRRHGDGGRARARQRFQNQANVDVTYVCDVDHPCRSPATAVPRPPAKRRRGPSRTSNASR